jgi:hypothetical protein
MELRNLRYSVAVAEKQVHELGDPMFVELDSRRGDGLTVTLEWNRDTGQIQIVLADIRADGLIAFGVPPANAADAFRHPFRYAP